MYSSRNNKFCFQDCFKHVEGKNYDVDKYGVKKKMKENEKKRLIFCFFFLLQG